MTSDNPSGADNQQERPGLPAWVNRIPSDVGYYVAGFVDGEGSFNVPIRRERDRGLPWRVSLSFNVSQIGEEAPCFLRSVFGAGTVRGRGDGVFYFEVTRPTELRERVFPFFDRFPLRGSKAGDLAVFRRITELVLRGRHLSADGIIEILELRAPMNTAAESAGAATTRSSRRCRHGILRGHTQSSPSKRGDEDMVHTLWRHRESCEL